MRTQQKKVVNLARCNRRIIKLLEDYKDDQFWFMEDMTQTEWDNLKLTIEEYFV